MKTITHSFLGFALIGMSACSAQLPKHFLGSFKMDPSLKVLEMMRVDGPTQGTSEREFEAELSELRTAISRQLPEERLRINITSNAITYLTIHGSQISYPYRVIKNCSSYVVLDIDDNAGFNGITRLTKLEEGIALSQSDCDAHPQSCVSEKQDTSRCDDAARASEHLPTTMYFVREHGHGA